ncbi:MAG: hypothetical protein U0176_04525 [Bacteroidia bacterium]
MILMLTLIAAGTASAQKGNIAAVVAHKWRVIWYSDNGEEKNMEAKKQQLILREDGTGEMFMMGQKVGDVNWMVASGKDKITFQDDPLAEPYLVKVSKYKKGLNMLFTGTMPNGVERKVYFERLLGK